MMKFFVFFGLLVCALASECIVDAQNSNHVAHVHYVAKSNATSGNKNFLFRGGTPETSSGTSFDYNKLISSIQYAASQSGETLPTKFNLVSIDLRTFKEGSFDATEALAEFQFFQQNPQLGQYVFWHTAGTDTAANGSIMTPGLRSYLVGSLDDWLPDLLIERTEALYAMLNDKSVPPNTVIYVHCDCGCDRTGEMIGSFMMRYYGKTWKEVNQRNTVVANRPMNCPNYRSMQWFCIHLAQDPNCLTTYSCS